MSYTPYNAPLLSGLLGDPECAACFSVAAEMKALNRFESALAKVQGQLGLIPFDAASQIENTIVDFQPDLSEIQAATARDGVIIPNYVAQLRKAVGDECASYVHFGVTSQDVIDTSLVLRLQSVNQILLRRLSDVLNNLGQLEQQFADRPMMARTRMQQALPICVSDRVKIWRQPLINAQESFARLQADLAVVQLGGPVGTLQKFGDNGPELRKALADALDLNDPQYCWHTDRARLVHYASWLVDISTALGKMGQDMALMAQNEISEIAFSSSGSSSAMPHKQNPVKAEILVTLARFNAGQLGVLQQAALHEQERSGANWTLEWMILPQIVMACGAGLLRSFELLSEIEQLGSSIDGSD